LIEIFGEGAASGGGEAVFGAGDAAFEKLYAGNVLGFFEFAGVDAEVAVGGFEDALEVVEAEGIVGGEGADDAEADALVDQAVEFGEFGGEGGRMLAGVGMRVVTGLIVKLGRVFSCVFSVTPGSTFACLRDGSGLATVPPGDDESEDDVEAAEAGGQKPVAPGRGAKDGEAAEQHEAESHDGDGGDGEGASGHDSGAIEEQPGGGQGGLQAGAKQQEGEEGSGDQGRSESEGDFAGRAGK
jgi:hypothetical protein